jgi:hypothetical protein
VFSGWQVHQTATKNSERTQVSGIAVFPTALLRTTSKKLSSGSRNAACSCTPREAAPRREEIYPTKKHPKTSAHVNHGPLL